MSTHPASQRLSVGDLARSLGLSPNDFADATLRALDAGARGAEQIEAWIVEEARNAACRITILFSLAFLALRHDTLAALAAATSALPSFGRPRTVHYRALANEAALAAFPLLPPVRDPARKAVLDRARARAAASVASRTMAARFSLGLRADVVCKADEPALCACCAPDVADLDPEHTPDPACGCDLCLTAWSELSARADELREEAVEHMLAQGDEGDEGERSGSVSAPPSPLPWQRAWTRGDALRGWL